MPRKRKSIGSQLAALRWAETFTVEHAKALVRAVREKVTV